MATKQEALRSKDPKGEMVCSSKHESSAGVPASGEFEGQQCAPPIHKHKKGRNICAFIFVHFPL